MLSKNTTQYHKYIITYTNNMVVKEEEEEDEEEEKQVTEIPEVVENFIGCDPIQSPLLPNSPQIQSEPPSPSHESSIVGVNIINNRDQSSLMAIFPPINHEGLYISSFHAHHENYPEFDRSLPARDFEQANSPLPLPRPRVAAWFNFLCCKLTSITSTIRNYSASSRGGFLSSFRSPLATVAAAMLLMLWYWRFQRQRRLLIRRESRDQLIRVIRERDEVPWFNLFPLFWVDFICL